MDDTQQPPRRGGPHPPCRCGLRHLPGRAIVAQEPERHEHGEPQHRRQDDHPAPSERVDEQRPREIHHDVRREPASHEESESGGPPRLGEVPRDQDHAGDEHERAEDAADGLSGEHPAEVGAEREGDGESVGAEDADGEDELRAHAIGDEPCGYLHERVRQGGDRGEQACLREAEVEFCPDQRQEQGDCADRNRLRGLCDHDERAVERDTARGRTHGTPDASGRCSVIISLS